MDLQHKIRQGLLVVLKHSLNPLTRRVARSRLGPFAIIRHVGRRSGKPYETPIIARPVAEGFVIELTYGPEVDWHKNVLAAGGCTVSWHGRDFVIDQIEPMDPDTGRAAFSPVQQLILRVLHRRHFELMKLQHS